MSLMAARLLTTRQRHWRSARSVQKKPMGTLNGRWVPHDVRDAVVDYVHHWKHRTEIPVKRFIGWLGVREGKFYEWKNRYGQVNEHNGQIPRAWWLEDWEKQAILDFQREYPLEGYRRLCFMMLDRDIVAVSPASVYRVLKAAGVIGRRNVKPSQKGTGFVQPLGPHEHWHIDVSYLNISGTFYYLCSILDGASRFIVHWEIRESMTEADVETILQRAREKFPGEKPRIISDNGPQFIAKDFKGPTFGRCPIRHRLRHPRRPTRRPTTRDLRRTRPQTRSRPRTPPAAAGRTMRGGACLKTFRKLCSKSTWAEDTALLADPKGAPPERRPRGLSECRAGCTTHRPGRFPTRSL
jgi:transposase-like protein